MTETNIDFDTEELFDSKQLYEHLFYIQFLMTGIKGSLSAYR